MKIGILAGLGQLPSYTADILKQKNKPFVFFSLISPEHAQELYKKHPYALDAVYLNKYSVAESLQTLITYAITHVFCIGKIEKTSIFSITNFDNLGLKILFNLATHSDTSILNALEKLLNKHGILVIPQKELLDITLIKKGFQSQSISKKLSENILFGMHIATTIAQTGIGQTIVIKNKTVIAVEAVEGTNACIQRAYDIAGSQLIICKTNNALNQKNDLPTLGIETLQAVPKEGIEAIAWNANETLIVDQDNFIKKAQELSIALWAI